MRGLAFSISIPCFLLFHTPIDKSPVWIEKGVIFRVMTDLNRTRIMVGGAPQDVAETVDQVMQIINVTDCPKAAVTTRQ